jgi:two-component sensor histidine kinase/PAS domain-containing protein
MEAMLREAFLASVGKRINWNTLLETIVRHNHESSLAILDKNLIMLYVTDNYYKDPDLKDKPIIGRHLYDIYPNVTDEWKDINRRALKGETIRHDEDVQIRNDGTIEHMRWGCFPWYDTGDQVGGLVLYTTYTNDLAREKEARQRREDDLREAYLIAGLGHWETAVGHHRLRWSDTVFEIFEIDKNCPDIFTAYCEAIHPEDREWVLEAHDTMIRDMISNDQAPFKTEYRLLMKDGRTKWIMQTCRTQYDVMGNPVNIVGIVQDITEAKNHEQTLRHLVEEKDTLLVELRHRIKNNLQVMMNLLSLEIAKNGDPAIKQALNESLARLQSMAMVYDQLHRSNSYQDVDPQWYLKELAAVLFRTYTNSESNLKLVTGFDKTRISSDRLIPLGLILNELIMNSVKYAYPLQAAESGGDGLLSREIRIRLENLGDHAILSVEDDGCGLPGEFNSPQMAGTGLKLVDTLARQLGGVCKISSLGGTQIAVRFPL